MLAVNSLYELLSTCPSQQDCIDHLEEVVWGNEPCSPFVPEARVYKYANGKYKCGETGKYFNVMHGTMFENTKIKLSKWFMAIWLLSTDPNGLTSVKLAKDIRITQKSAWFMLQRIRSCYLFENNNKLSGTIEMDESWIGGKNKNRHVKKRAKYKSKKAEHVLDKTLVLGMIERGGKLNAWKIPNRGAFVLQKHVRSHAYPGSRLISDEWHGYKSLRNKYDHIQLKHKSYEYVSLGDTSIFNNTIEGTWKIMKRSLHWNYNHISDKHLQIYLDEFVFRFNTRKQKSIDKFNSLLAHCNVRTRYRDLAT